MNFTFYIDVFTNMQKMSNNNHFVNNLSEVTSTSVKVNVTEYYLHI